MTSRAFLYDGEEWIAWVSGNGAYGTGPYGLGSVEAVHFARAQTPGVPVMEALLAAGRLEGLFDEELIELFRGARQILDASELPQGRVSRRRSVDQS